MLEILLLSGLNSLRNYFETYGSFIFFLTVVLCVSETGPLTSYKIRLNTKCSWKCIAIRDGYFGATCTILQNIQFLVYLIHLASFS